MTYELSAATAKYFFVQPDQTQSLSIWPQDCWKFRNCLSTLIGRDRRAHAGQPQKIINNQTFLFLFEKNSKRNSIHRKTQLFLLFSVLLKFFCKKKPWSAELDSFFQTDQRPPVRSYTSQLSLWFSTGLRVRGLMGHIMILIMGFHPDVEESDSRVFNHSLMWWSKLNLHKPRLLWTHCNESCYIL